MQLNGGIIMAKIIYKKGKEEQNNLSSIEGIEIDLLNGQKALIYPKYAEKRMLSLEKAREWDAPEVTEIEALKVTDVLSPTSVLCSLDSPAAQWARQFMSDDYGFRLLPSLLAAMEIQHQKKEIDEFAETIEGADLLRDFTSDVWSCSRYFALSCWYANGSGGYTINGSLSRSCLVVPIILIFPVQENRNTL